MLLICVSMIAWSDGKPDIGEGNAAQFWKLRVPVLSLLESSPMNADLPKMMKSFVIFSSSCATQSQRGVCGVRGCSGLACGGRGTAALGRPRSRSDGGWSGVRGQRGQIMPT